MPYRFASARKLKWIVEKRKRAGEGPGPWTRGKEILIIPIFTGYDNEVDFLDSSYSANFHFTLVEISTRQAAGNSCQDFFHVIIP